jgi:hypothetical protein
MFYYLNDRDKKYREIDDHLEMLYNHSSLTNTEIRLLLDLSPEAFDDLLNKMNREKRLDTNFRKYGFREVKNYYRYNPPHDSRNRYVVRKVIDGKAITFCYCRSEAEARFIVGELRKCGWDRSMVKEIKNKIK